MVSYKDPRGFTVNELLTVISAILVLTALMLPVFSKVGAVSEEATCMNNLRLIGVAFKMYAEDLGGGSVFPPVYNPSGVAGRGRYWVDFLAPYTKAKGKYDKAARPSYAGTLFDCPSLTEYTTAMVTDYAYFRVLWANSADAPNDIKNIGKPQEVGLVADAEFFTDGTPQSARIGLTGVSNSRAILRNRHNNGVNILYCDGHAEHLSAQTGDDLRHVFDASRR